MFHFSHIVQFIFVKMRECDIWKDMSEQEFGNAKEGMEKLVMNRLYHVLVFQFYFIPEEEIKHFILEHFVQIQLTIKKEMKFCIKKLVFFDGFVKNTWIFQKPSIMNHFYRLLNQVLFFFLIFSYDINLFISLEILKINNYKAPRDKLICILNCCKVIFG